LKLEAEAVQEVFKTQDAKEGIKAFSQRRKSIFKGE
jgi:1,4-dihydroxy-2-naphthoyl-CoA synthase